MTDYMTSSSALAIKDAPGLFYFTLYNNNADIANAGSYNTHNQVLKQTMTLKEVRVEFDTSAHALACRELRFKFPWISIFHVLDSDLDKFHLRVPLDNAAVTIKYGLEQKVTMSHNIHEAFDYLISNYTGGTDVTGLRYIMLVFQFDYSATT